MSGAVVLPSHCPLWRCHLARDQIAAPRYSCAKPGAYLNGSAVATYRRISSPWEFLFDRRKTHCWVAVIEVRLLLAAGGSNQLACQPTTTRTVAWSAEICGCTLCRL